MYAWWTWVVILAVGTEPTTEVLRQDFRGGKFPESTFALFGKNAGQHVKAEPEGVRITLSAQDQPKTMTGLLCKPKVEGDFDITVSYEILRAENLQGGYGLGLSLSLIATSPASDQATLARRVDEKDGEVYGSARSYQTADKKERHQTKRFPAADRRGRLRLARVGSMVIYSVAGAHDKEFRELRREPFVTAPLRVIRVTADTGQGLGELDVRITELLVRTGPASETPAAVAPVAETTIPVGTQRRPWLTTVVVVAFGILLTLGGLLSRLILRRGKQGTAAQRPNPKSN